MSEWRKIFNGRYEVSDEGQVRSLIEYRNHKPGKIMSLTKEHDGYLRVEVQISRGSPKKLPVHVLVATAFLGPPPDDHEVNHKNGIKDDNRLDNLEWATHSANIRHADRTGLRKLPAGDACWNSKLTERQAAAARALYLSGMKPKTILSLYHVSRATLGEYVSGRKRPYLEYVPVLEGL